MSSVDPKIDKIKSANERMKELNSRIIVEHYSTIRLEVYFRVCRSLLNMANHYEKDGCKTEAYALRRRFVILFVDHLSQRQDFKNSDPKVRQLWRKECDRVLKRVEEMYNEILEDFKAEFEMEMAPRAPSPLTDLPKSLSPNTSTIPSPGVPNSASPKPSPPKIDRSTKPRYEPSKVVSNADFHPVLVPNTLVPTFLRYAESNTRKNLETCGTLCGRLCPTENKLIISHLILCKQIVTPNSCTTTHEEELLACMDFSDLIVIGWIHTHPTQTAFMSSIDLHCQLSYQLMLPEAIAIVCSPKYNEIEYFSLTPDYGLEFILECQKTGFHEHAATKDLYTRCKHVIFSDAPLEVRDLR